MSDKKGAKRALQLRVTKLVENELYQFSNIVAYDLDHFATILGLL